MKRLALPGVVISLLLMMTGCSHFTKRAPLSVDRTTIATIRYKLEQSGMQYRSMKAHAEISVESPQINFSATSKIVLKQNDSLLVQIKAPFGIGAASIFVDKNQFLVYNSFENSLYYGDPQSSTLKKFFPVDIKMEEIFYLFSGIHLLDLQENDSLMIDNNQYLVVVPHKDQTQKYWIDPKKFVVTEFQLIGPRKEKLLGLEYKQFEKKNNIYLPKLIQITQPRRKARLTILYSDRNVNCQLKEEDFRFKVPDHVDRIKL